MELMELFEDDLESLLAVPACALDAVLGSSAPATYRVHRADGREAHHRLLTAIDRLRREYDGHPASTYSFAEDLQRLYVLLAPLLHPWPPLRTSSPEASDREIREEWRSLLAPWPAVELDAAPVRSTGTPPASCRSHAGLIAVPGRGGTTWTLADMLTPAGMARIRGIARAGMHVYWRPAAGSPGAILVDDVTDVDHPETPSWLRWAQPHAYIQTSRFKAQAIFRLPDRLVAQGDALVAHLNRERGDPGVRASGHWMRLPGCWNHKSLGQPWCVRILGMGLCSAMAEAWLAHEAVRMKRDVAKRLPVSPQAPKQDAGAFSRALPEPEAIRENRNVEASRYIGRCFARCWGDADGVWEDALRWNRRLPEPLSEAELRTIHRSIQREDMDHHPERWRHSGASAPARRSAPSRPSSSSPQVSCLSQGRERAPSSPVVGAVGDRPSSAKSQVASPSASRQAGMADLLADLARERTASVSASVKPSDAVQEDSQTGATAVEKAGRGPRRP